MASTFHPQLFRGAAGSSCSASSKTGGSGIGSAGAAAAASSVSAASSLPSSINSSKGCIATPASILRDAHTSSTSPSLRQETHGLQVDSAQFPPHSSFVVSPSSSSSTSPEESRVRLISAHQYANLVYQHSNIKLQDERILFPWLHGADIPYSAQAENFGFKNGQFQAVPK